MLDTGASGRIGAWRRVPWVADHRSSTDVPDRHITRARLRTMRLLILAHFRRSYAGLPACLITAYATESEAIGAFK